MVRDRSFEDDAECMNIQAHLYGIRNRHFNKESVKERWNEYLKPRLAAAEAAAEERSE